MRRPPPVIRILALSSALAALSGRGAAQVTSKAIATDPARIDASNQW